MDLEVRVGQIWTEKDSRFRGIRKICVIGAGADSSSGKSYIFVENIDNKHRSKIRPDRMRSNYILLEGPDVKPSDVLKLSVFPAMLKIVEEIAANKSCSCWPKGHADGCHLVEARKILEALKKPC